jgi:hypothetical protein
MLAAVVLMVTIFFGLVIITAAVQGQAAGTKR